MNMLAHGGAIGNPAVNISVFGLFLLFTLGFVALLLGVVGTYLGRHEPHAEQRFAEMEVRSLTGAGIDSSAITKKATAEGSGGVATVSRSSPSRASPCSRSRQRRRRDGR